MKESLLEKNNVHGKQHIFSSQSAILIKSRNKDTSISKIREDLNEGITKYSDAPPVINRISRNRETLINKSDTEENT